MRLVWAARGCHLREHGTIGASPSGAGFDGWFLGGLPLAVGL